MPEVAPEAPKTQWSRVYLRSERGETNTLVVEKSHATVLLAYVANGVALRFTDREGKQWVFAAGNIKVINVSDWKPGYGY